MRRNAQHRAQAAFGELGPVRRIRLHEVAPCFSVGAEFARSCPKIALQDRGGAIIQRMSEGGIAMHPFKSVICERKRIEERRPGGQRMDGGSGIVKKARQGKWQSAASATWNCFGLVDVDGDAGARKRNGRGEAVGAGADDDGALHVFVSINHEVATRRAIE